MTTDHPTIPDKKLNVATCQFPVSSKISANLEFVLHLMREARAQGADVAHFPEACLSGYVDNDIDTNAHVDWFLLEAAVRDVMALSALLRLWVVIGAAHRLTPPNKPHNSLYFINDYGQIVERFVSGDASRTTGDLAHYSPGNHFSVVEIKGVRCGAVRFQIKCD
jgi:deaminated glutathione amidase